MVLAALDAGFPIGASAMMMDTIAETKAVDAEAPLAFINWPLVRARGAATCFPQ
jgi:hypothetical protein